MATEAVSGVVGTVRYGSPARANHTFPVFQERVHGFPDVDQPIVCATIRRGIACGPESRRPSDIPPPPPPPPPRPVDLSDAVLTSSCTLDASIETSYLPYPVGLDVNGDAMVDVDISNVACPTPDGHISLQGFKIRIPYIDFSVFLDPLSSPGTSCEDLANGLSQRVCATLGE